MLLSQPLVHLKRRHNAAIHFLVLSLYRVNLMPQIVIQHPQRFLLLLSLKVLQIPLPFQQELQLLVLCLLVRQ